MNRHVGPLKQLIADGMYVVDGQAVADAILARASVRRTVPSASFASDLQPPAVRSFRRDSDVRSFRLERRERLHRVAY